MASWLRAQADAADYNVIQEAKALEARKLHEREMYREAFLREEAASAALVADAQAKARQDVLRDVHTQRAAEADDNQNMRAAAACIIIVIIVLISVCSAGHCRNV